MNKFDEIIALQKQLQKKLSDFGQEAIVDHWKVFFEKYPEIDGIVWNQYTPYFNDGDACVFNVYEVYPISQQIFENEDLEDIIYSNGYYHEYDFEIRYNVKVDYYKLLQEELEKTHHKIPEDIHYAVFGDHATITIMRDGTVTITEYDHD